jgi:hypothetical protein
MRLNPRQKARIIIISQDNKLKYVKKKFELISLEARKENIFITAKSVRKILKKWAIYSKAAFKI